MFAVALVSITSVAVATMEIAVLSQLQQDADARGCSSTSPAVNASQGRCIKTEIQADNAEADGSADEEEDNEEDNSNDDD